MAIPSFDVIGSTKPNYFHRVKGRGEGDDLLL